MDRFDALLHRKSTRKYVSRPVEEKILDDIRTEIETVPLVFPAAGLKIELIEAGDKIHRALRGFIGNLGKNIAPHYLVLSGKALPGMRENAGFAGEHLIINMTARGLATCWLGGLVKDREIHNIVDTEQGYELAALIAFGYPVKQDDYLRTDITRISRKPLKQLMTDGRIDQFWQPLLETARIAPSALNLQPWRFLCDGRPLYVFIKQAGSFISRKLLEDINYVDAGIALCHISEAANYFKRTITIEKEPMIKHSGLSYVATVIDMKK